MWAVDDHVPEDQNSAPEHNQLAKFTACQTAHLPLMQTILHASCFAGESIRDAIGRDAKLGSYRLRIESRKRQGRRSGWTKIKSTAGHDGAINVNWDAKSRLLICRVVTRGGNPAPITGEFTAYLIARFRRRIQAITIVTER